MAAGKDWPMVTDHVPFARADDPLCLLVPREIERASRTRDGVLLYLKALRLKKEEINVSMLQKGVSYAFTGEWGRMTLRVQLLSDTDLRVRMAEGESIPELRQPMLLAEPESFEEFTYTEDADAIRVTTGRIAVELCRNPFRLRVLDETGRTLYEQYNDDAHNVTSDRRRGHREDGSNADALDPALSFPGFLRYPSGLAKNERTGATLYAQTVRLQHGERFYGFGESFSRLNKAGQEIFNEVTNPVGVSNARSYKCAPFFLSSRGYAAYYNTPRRIRFQMGADFFKAYSAEAEAPLLDLFLFFRKSHAQNLLAYGDLTGHSALPPKWAFGVWMSRNCYMTGQEVEEVAAELRTRSLPCDVMHIDWAYCKTTDYDFEFDTARFPNVMQMAQRLLAKGMRLSAWQLPYIRHTSPVFQEAAAHHALALEKDGSIADAAQKQAVIDFSSPEAVDWYKGKLRALLQQGIRVIKTDFGECASEHYVYKTVDGADMHNLYPLFYNKAAYEVCEEVHPGDSLIWGRSAYAGCQRYPVYWGGDSDSDFAGMYHSLRGGLSLGLSGFPFWSHDVGGYFGTPEPAVYIRWLQFGMLSPLVRFHGTSAREPWAFGEEAVRQYQKYAVLRYSLMEYLYGEAGKCTEDCTPMLRALALDFPEDPAAGEIDDEYLLGRNILVVPVFSTDATRTVYLPAGTAWLDYHTFTWHEGGQTVTIDTPIDITPVFLRGGTATPFIEPMQHVDERPVEYIRWEICPAHDSALYELKTDKLDIRMRYDFEESTGTGRLVVKGAPAGMRMEYRIHCPDVKRLYCNGREIPFAYGDNRFALANIQE